MPENTKKHYTFSEWCELTKGTDIEPDGIFVDFDEVNQMPVVTGPRFRDDLIPETDDQTYITLIYTMDIMFIMPYLVRTDNPEVETIEREDLPAGMPKEVVCKNGIITDVLGIKSHVKPTDIYHILNTTLEKTDYPE